MGKPKAIRDIEKLDRDVSREARRLRELPPVHAVGEASDLADQPPLATICLATLAFGLGARDRRLARTGARMFAAFAVATLLKGLVKRSIDRTRPFVAEELGYQSRRGQRNEGPWNSFPSGHTAGALAVARSVSREYPAAHATGLAVAATVGAAQLPRGAHYLTDVAAGALVGLAAEAVTNRLFPAA